MQGNENEIGILITKTREIDSRSVTFRLGFWRAIDRGAWIGALERGIRSEADEGLDKTILGFLAIPRWNTKKRMTTQDVFFNHKVNRLNRLPVEPLARGKTNIFPFLLLEVKKCTKIIDNSVYFKKYIYIQ